MLICSLSYIPTYISIHTYVCININNIKMHLISDCKIILNAFTNINKHSHTYIHSCSCTHTSITDESVSKKAYI